MPQRGRTSLGLDVGGTRIRAARITPEGEIIDRLIEPVVPDRAGFIKQVLRLIDTQRDETTQTVGIGIPGRVIGTSGIVQTTGYLSIDDLCLAHLVTVTTKLPCRVQNDAAMALIAEGRGTTGLIAMITVGTGIGGALLRDGSPLYGNGLAGQFGHIVVAPDGPLCNCGRRGCVETFSAGPALGNLIAAAGLPAGTTAAALLNAADNGDDLAETIMTNWASPMERALQTVVAVVDPSQVIFGGGLGIDMARALLRIATPNRWFGRPIVAARLGDDAGVIGAGLAGFLELDTV